MLNVWAVVTDVLIKASCSALAWIKYIRCPINSMLYKILEGNPVICL